jgi:hypothetical protein
MRTQGHTPCTGRPAGALAWPGARPLGLTRGRERAARPGDPALHRHHAADGRRGAAARGRAPDAGQAAAGPRARRAQRELRHARAQAGVHARSARLAGPARAVHGRARAPVRAAAAPPRARLAGRRARDRRRRDPPGAPRRGDLRARAVRAAAAARRGRVHDRRRARRGAAEAGLGAPAPRARRQAGARRAARPVQAPRIRASTSSATRTAIRSTSASPSACARAPARTSRRPSPGRDRPSTSTTSRRSPSSARCCSRTG